MLGKHLDLGALATGSAEYKGQHRDQEMSVGWGLIPHGDRERDKLEYGVDYVETRGSDANAWRI